MSRPVERKNDNFMAIVMEKEMIASLCKGKFPCGGRKERKKKNGNE